MTTEIVTDDIRQGEVQIRAMSKEDLPAVLEVIRAHNIEHAKCAEKEIPNILDNKSKKFGFFIAEARGKIIGCVGFIQDDEVHDIYWAIWLYVLYDYRRRKTGSQLWAEMESQVKKLGARKLYFDVGNEIDHPEAIAFHTKNGFTLEGKLDDYFKDGEDKLIYGRRL